MTILTHNFNEINIAQLSDEATIGGAAIPKGYVNATQLCKAGKKKLNDWTRLNSSKAYIEALWLDTGIPATRLMLELKGTPTVVIFHKVNYRGDDTELVARVEHSDLQLPS